jgi:hypothetical protein
VNFDVLNEEQRHRVDTARAVASRSSREVWLVGGPVRDLLMKRPVGDLDFVLEREAGPFTADYAAALGGTVQSFPRFATFKIILSGGAEIDVTTARGETYRSPGALPEVVPASLIQDLGRRDFSMNALALHLTSLEVVDTTGGIGDLAAGILRILHHGSFEDDPTRLFRGVRLATRLGFAFEDRTEERMLHAVRTDAVASVSRERIWREIALGMAEGSPGEVLAAFLHRALADRFLQLGARRPSPRELIAVDRILAATTTPIDRIAAFLGLLLTGSEGDRWSEGSPLSARQKKIIGRTAGAARPLAEASRVLTPGQLFQTASSLPDEAIVAAAAMETADSSGLQRLVACRHHPIGPLTGPSMAGGRHIGRALAAAREALFAGQIESGEVDTFARERALQYLSGQA